MTRCPSPSGGHAVARGAGTGAGTADPRIVPAAVLLVLAHPRVRLGDDTVLTVAVADCLLHGRDYVDALHDYFHAYPNAGYGATFFLWAMSRRREPYKSWGNGSAMRVSPVAYVGSTLEEVLAEAKRSAE